MKGIHFFKLFLMSAILLCWQPVFAESDADIVKNIESKLAADKLTAGLHLKVMSQAGVVTLEGKADSDAEASKAIEIAESTPGVNDTETSQLSVKESKQPFTDSAITAKVKGTFVREKLFGEKEVSVMGVTVETTNGVVYLSGAVDTAVQANNAVKLAKSVKGVKSVDSKITIKPMS